MSRKPLQVRMDPTILARLQRLADARGLNVQDLVRAFTAERLVAEERKTSGAAQNAMRRKAG